MSSGGGSKTVVVDPYSGTGIRELYKQLTGYVSPYIGQGLTPYQGQIYPPASELQQQGFSAAGGLTPLSQAGLGYFGNVLSATDPMAAQKYEQMAASGLQNVMQPFDSSLVNQIMEPAKQLALNTYQQDIIPMIMERYGAGAGAKNAGAVFSELGKQGANLSLGLSNQMANYLFPAWQNQLNRQQTGVGQAMQLSQIPGQTLSQAGQIGGLSTDMLSQLINMGGVQRDITGQGLQEEYQKWQMAQPYNSPYLSTALNLLSQGAAMPNQVGFQQQSPSLTSMLLPGLGSALGGYFGSGGTLGAMGSSIIPGGLGGLLGGAGGALTGLLALSDINFKENFIKIENALDKLEELEGQTYNFKGNDTRTAGLIAQDVEKVLPEAVIEHHGIKFVDPYAIIALLANAIKELKNKVEG